MVLVSLSWNIGNFIFNFLLLLQFYYGNQNDLLNHLIKKTYSNYCKVGLVIFYQPMKFISQALRKYLTLNL